MYYGPDVRPDIKTAYGSGGIETVAIDLHYKAGVETSLDELETRLQEDGGFVCGWSSDPRVIEVEKIQKWINEMRNR